MLIRVSLLLFEDPLVYPTGMLPVAGKSKKKKKKKIKKDKSIKKIMHHPKFQWNKLTRNVETRKGKL